MGSPGPEALILPLSLLSPGSREIATPSLGLEAQCPKEGRVRQCVQGRCRVAGHLQTIGHYLLLVINILQDASIFTWRWRASVRRLSESKFET